MRLAQKFTNILNALHFLLLIAHHTEGARTMKLLAKHNILHDSKRVSKR